MPRNSLEFVCAPVATPPVEHRLSSHSRLSLRVRRRLFPIKMPPSIGRLSGWSHSAGEPPAKGACGWRIRRRVKITLPSQPITSKPPCRALSPQTSNGYRSLSPRGRAGLGHWRSLSGTSQPGSGRAAAFDSEKTRDRKSPRSQIRQRRRLEKSQRFGKRRSALPFSELNRLGAELAWGDIISGAFARLRKDPTLTGKRGNDPDMGLLSKCNMGHGPISLLGFLDGVIGLLARPYVAIARFRLLFFVLCFFNYRLHQAKLESINIPYVIGDETPWRTAKSCTQSAMLTAASPRVRDSSGDGIRGPIDRSLNMDLSVRRVETR
ncbi:hypothetical protein AUP68_04524 [Ilyonectria robusta]